MELKLIKMNIPENTNIVLGQSHFIKTVEDIYESIASSSYDAKFGVAFCEASGECLVRYDGNDEEMKKVALENALALSCGHSFNIILKNAYPINILTQLKTVPEVCNIYAATSNPLYVIVAENEQGRGIMGVIDGYKSKGFETEKDIQWRKEIIRKFGYKA